MAKTLREKQMRLDSLAFGADCGLTIPVNSGDGEVAILMLAQRQGQNCLDHWEDIQYELLALAHYYMHYLRDLLIKEQTTVTNKYQLNNRQMQCLRLTAAGHSMEEIANKLEITIRTVNYHIQKMNKNLGMKK